MISAKEDIPMDITKEAEQIVSKLTADPTLIKQFSLDPVKLLEKTFKIDLPDDQINKLIKEVTGKLSSTDTKDLINSAMKSIDKDGDGIDLKDVTDLLGKLK